ncbi:MAG: alkaline phosphatase family protein [Gemmatimonadetes bacterium]|nr:alkaline phosphatase family protein [Gemmatimonadota bacterium]
MRSDVTRGKTTHRWWRAVQRAGLAVICAGCVTTRVAPPDPATLPTRLVLALDGVDYRDIVTARAAGRFAEFGAPGRLVSTFPSISDIAWHAIFGVQPPAGYQRVFFSASQNSMLGDALSAIRPIEYEERMDLAFDAKFHHLGAYLMSGRTARREVDGDVRAVLQSSGRPTLYAYNIGPDALQHTRGNLDAYLAHLDAKLVWLRAQYRERTGRELEIVLLSDHGHNRAAEATFLPVADALRAHGFRSARALDGPDDVAFSVDGVTTGFGVFCQPGSVARLVAALVGVTGIDVVTWRVAADTFGVATNGGEARIVVRHATSGVPGYRADVVRGDPIGLTAALAALRSARQLDTDGFATADAWLRATVDADYPGAVPRIVHGHTDATRNPAPVLVSVDDRYRVGLGLVSITNRLRPLGGTHGSLHRNSSLGVVMSTAGPMRDGLAMQVRDRWGGFADLRDARAPKAAVAIVSAGALGSDPRGGRWLADAVDGITAPQPMVVLSPGVRLGARWDDVDSVVVSVLHRDGRRVLRRASTPRDAWRCGSGAHRCVASASRVGLDALTANTSYVVRVELLGHDGGEPGRTGRSWRRPVVTTGIRAASDGVPWSW